MLNIYNPLNNIKYTKEKKKLKKIYQVLDLLKVKYHTKNIYIYKSLNSPHSKY